MQHTVTILAETLAAYENEPYNPDAAEAVDVVAETLRGLAEAEDPEHPNTGAVLALLAVVQLSLDEDGFRFIPAARVLCAAVQGGF